MAKQTRKFGGKAYTRKATHKTKREAESHASNIRNTTGHNVRVVKGTYGVAHLDSKGNVKKRETIKGYILYTSPSKKRTRIRKKWEQDVDREYRFMKHQERMERSYRGR